LTNFFNFELFLLECDICVIKLMDDLEANEHEFCTLKNQLESYSRNVTSYTGLDKLEDAIAGAKVTTTIAPTNANVFSHIVF